LGDGKEHGEDPAWDAAEAEALYTLLEQEVIPMFYERDRDGNPSGWIKRMRESMAQLTPRFSANRTVREYTEEYYLPAAKNYRRRAANKGAAGAELVSWRHVIEQNWSKLRFGEVKVESDEEKHTFEVQVYFGDLDPDAVRVELYANGIDGAAPIRQEMTRGQRLAGGNSYLYNGQVQATRPASEYTPRVIPSRPGVSVPLEASQILWQR
jgi:starch phosphorylase